MDAGKAKGGEPLLRCIICGLLLQDVAGVNEPGIGTICPECHKERHPKALLRVKPGKVAPLGQELLLELSWGETGDGQVLGSVACEPWNAENCLQAGRDLAALARTFGVEIIWRQ